MTRSGEPSSSTEVTVTPVSTVPPWDSINETIARLIAAEPPHDTLSDDKLVDVLRAEGFDIARRTVAKYREAMNIGSSVARRRAKLLEAAV